MIETKRMWEGGPLRQVSAVKEKVYFIPYSNRIFTGFAGHYVCEQCNLPSASGVRLIAKEIRWQCLSCEMGRTRKPTDPAIFATRIAKLREARV